MHPVQFYLSHPAILTLILLSRMPLLLSVSLASISITTAGNNKTDRMLLQPLDST
jgi:hypothetical protein